MKLRQGKTKNIIESSIDSALLAVEIYNKPRTSFRREGYISLMSMSWNKLFHAYFNQIIGDKYYYKQKNGRYKLVDGEKKTWELKTSIKKYQQISKEPLSDSVEANLNFFVLLRNKIEHRHISRMEIDNILFGEYQALLYNYENLLIKLFGEEFSLNENLSFSLQFSKIRTDQQKIANKEILSKDVVDIKSFVDSYRLSLSDEIYSSQEYSVKLIQIPKISNTNRNDVAVEFVNWSDLSDQDKENYEKITTIIKDKVVKVEAINVGKLRATDLINEVNEKCINKINQFDHKCLYFIFSIRPVGKNIQSPFDTNTKYCLYDEVHNDYIYSDDWSQYIINLFNKHGLTKEELRSWYRKGIKKGIEDYS